MTCEECDALNDAYCAVRGSRTSLFWQGRLTFESETSLDGQEQTCRDRISEHRIMDHKPGEKYL
jgi:hypothetical protein